MTLGISRIFRSTDASAPQLSNANGSLLNLLKKVLVDGYGSTDPLGWTLEFELSNVGVFRPSKGTRRFLRVDDSVGSFLSGGYNMYVAEMISYETMSSINNGTDRFPVLGQTQAYLLKWSHSTTSSPWMIIGDEAGFYFINNPYYTWSNLDTWMAHYFGDYNAWDIRNKWNYIHLPLYQHATAHFSTIYPHSPSTSVPHQVARGSNFAKGSVYVGFLPFNANVYFGHNILVQNSLGLEVNKLAGCYYRSPIHIYETVSNGSLVLGSLPGISEPILMENSVTLPTVPPLFETYTFPNGDMDIMIRVKQSSASTTITNGKIIFHVGKGFRNVQ